ncbi:MAG TPA: hypothetical protein VLC09_01585 [Polyangiaceae bacterium]|nr:hypothetical protein [Polyangiaceae bacterium]
MTSAAAAKSGVAFADPWCPSLAPPSGELVEVDPRVIAAHKAGKLPCPPNPAPPVGFSYWKGKAPKAGVELAARMLKNKQRYPMGAFVQAILGGVHTAARVEWHAVQGSTGKQGAFRGVNLMRKG